MNEARRKHRRGVRRDQEGAALLVVMMILLMVTATATFAIHSTAAEIRAAGHARMSMQTSYLGETAVVGAMDWVDRVGPRVLVDIIAAKEASRQQLPLEPLEAPLAPDRYAHRIYFDDLDPLGTPGSPLVAPSVAPQTMFSVGARSVYAPLALVDIYDVHVYTGVVSGYVASGGTSLRHMRATYTARGRARLADPNTNETNQAMHEAAGDARAVGISGPFAM